MKEADQLSTKPRMLGVIEFMYQGFSIRIYL
jgi:hypothetical protein